MTSIFQSVAFGITVLYATLLTAAVILVLGFRRKDQKRVCFSTAELLINTVFQMAWTLRAFAEALDSFLIAYRESRHDSRQMKCMASTQRETRNSNNEYPVVIR